MEHGAPVFHKVAHSHLMKRQQRMLN